MLLYLIVPLWYASAAYQLNLVEPWFLFWRRRRSQAKIPMARPDEPDTPPPRAEAYQKGTIRY